MSSGSDSDEEKEPQQKTGGEGKEGSQGESKGIGGLGLGLSSDDSDDDDGAAAAPEGQQRSAMAELFGSDEESEKGGNDESGDEAGNFHGVGRARGSGSGRHGDGEGGGDGSDEEELEDEDLRLPQLPSLPKGVEAFVARMPNIIGVQPKRFEPATYDRQQEESEFKTDNIMRWRYKTNAKGDVVRDPQTNRPVVESNSRLVKWSDGSMQLLIGDEAFDVAVRPNERSYLFAQQLTQDGSSCLECQATLPKRLSFKPQGLDSRVHKELSMRVKHKQIKGQGMMRHAEAADPEKLKVERIKQQEEAQKRDLRRTKAYGKYGAAQGGRRHAGMDAGFLEEDDQEYDTVAVRNIKDNTKKGRYDHDFSDDSNGSGSDKDEEEDDDDDDDDDDEEEEERQSSSRARRSRGKAKSRKRQGKGSGRKRQESKESKESESEPEFQPGDDDEEEEKSAEDEEESGDDDEEEDSEKEGGGGKKRSSGGGKGKAGASAAAAAAAAAGAGDEDSDDGDAVTASNARKKRKMRRMVDDSDSD